MYYLGVNLEKDKSTIRRLALYDENKNIKYENFDNQIHEFKQTKRKFFLYRDIFLAIGEIKFFELLKKIKDIKFVTNKDYKNFLIENDLHEYLI